jgi:hypothetical protein
MWWLRRSPNTSTLNGQAGEYTFSWMAHTTPRSAVRSWSQQISRQNPQNTPPQISHRSNNSNPFILIYNSFICPSSFDTTKISMSYVSSQAMGRFCRLPGWLWRPHQTLGWFRILNRWNKYIDREPGQIEWIIEYSVIKQPDGIKIHSVRTFPQTANMKTCLILVIVLTLGKLREILKTTSTF